jgi:hypothetical protein
MESPSHYTRGSIEVWDFIRDQNLSYHLGNVIKYTCRAGHKASNMKASDLKKAIHYLENELDNTTSTKTITFGSSNTVSSSVWDPELYGEPDYATGFDR